MTRLLTRENIKLAAVAVFCLLLAWTGPSVAHGVHAQFAHNADKVDGKHAVGAGASLNKAKGKLVAHGGSGKLPAKFIPKVKDADKVDGISSRQLQFPTVVPPGQTITGRWAFDDQGTGAPGDWGTSISYPAKLPTVPASFQFIQPPGTASTAACPGTYLAPKATPGVLCIYIGNRVGVTSNGGADASTVHGVTVLFSGTPGSDAYAYGTYAYRAPTSTSRVRLTGPAGGKD